MSNLQITPVTYAIHKKGESHLFGDDTIHLTVQDEGGGYYYTIQNVCPTDTSEELFGEGKLTLDTEEIIMIAELVKLIESGKNQIAMEL